MFRYPLFTFAGELEKGHFTVFFSMVDYRLIPHFYSLFQGQKGRGRGSEG